VNLVWRFRGSIKLGLAPGPQAQKELSTVPSEERKHSVLELIEGCLVPFADVNQLRQVDHRPPPRSSIHHSGHLANVGVFAELAEHESVRGLGDDPVYGAANGAPPCAGLRACGSQPHSAVSSNGIIAAIYARDGEVKTATIGGAKEPSQAELVRREKLKREA
jgi:hypothetical protein